MFTYNVLTADHPRIEIRIHCGTDVLRILLDPVWVSFCCYANPCARSCVGEFMLLCQPLCSVCLGEFMLLCQPLCSACLGEFLLLCQPLCSVLFG